MAFIIDKQGNYIPVLGETSGGGETPTNYIPNGTVYTVKADGTGDFVKISDALTFLVGKISDGGVKIEVSAGTFNDERIYVGSTTNIKKITVEGAGVENTTVNLGAGDYKILSTDGGFLSVNKINFVQTNGTKQYRGACAGKNGYLEIANCAFTNFNDFTVGVIQGAQCFLSGTLTFTDCTKAICCEAGSIYTSYGVNLNMKNLDTGIFVDGGGFIKLVHPNITVDNVANTYSKTKNQLTSAGIIFE